MSLPCCAYQRLEDGSEQPVVVIQAEIAPHGTILGVRPLTGGNGICMATEVRLLADGFGA
jgi:membrane protein involved in colicin uptake